MFWIRQRTRLQREGLMAKGVRVITVGLLGAVLSMKAEAEVKTTKLYIATQGNDAWSGTLPLPNRKKTDGPFATLKRAREEIGKLKAAGKLKSGATVFIRAGVYCLKEPLTFGPEDSGTERDPITYAAYPGEAPVLSGGGVLKGWRQVEGGRWQVQIPEVQRGEWNFTQLWVNGKRRYRPRLPKDGYYRIAKEVPCPKDKAPDSFEFKPGQFSAEWPDLQDVEVLVFHSWTMDRMRIKSVDAEKRVVTFTSPTLANVWFFDLRAGKRFIIENVGAALERPGEWHLDRKTGTLTYIPMPGETLANAQIIAPLLERLVQLRGDTALGLPVEHLVLRGLTFAHTNWVTPAEGWRCGQSECNLWGAVSAEGACDCVLDGCKITHIGTYAAEFGTGCKHCRVENCEITDLAAGGIKIGEQGMRNDEQQLTSHNIVRNNLIAHGGRMHAAGMGVWVGHSPFNVIEHNEICDFYQTGISVGWSWGYGPSQAHDNTVAYNRIYHLGQGVTDDMGGIYTLGLSPGTVLHHNLIHDVSCDSYGGRGIYFDEGTSDLLAENNLVYRTDTGAFMHHYGRNDGVINNIFALARGGQIDRLREEEHISFTFQHNIVYYDETGSLLAENWGNDKYVMEDNLYWNTLGQPVLFGNLTFEQWQRRGHDRNSLVADPLFADPENGDFTLKPDSPALKIGFKPFDMTTIGRLPSPGDEQPLAPRAFPPKPAPPPPEPIAEDFESVPIGQRAPDAITNEENEKATIRVTEEAASTGKRSLKFIDMPGQKFNFNPHMYYQTSFTSGVMEGHFDLRMEPGMQFYHEWRDITVWYKSGPLLRVLPDGTLQANGKNLMKLPHGKWIGFDIVCGLGKQSTLTYDLTVHLPGEAEPQRFTSIPYDPGFKAVHWLLFTAEGEQDGVCYVDNVRLAPRGAK